MLMSAGSENRIVSTRTFTVGAFLTRRMTRPMRAKRNTSKIETTFDPPSNSVVTSLLTPDANTTKKSKQFQLSSK